MKENKVPKPPGTAVALQYSGAGAPRVTAKGHGHVADEILRLADENEIPLYRDPELAGLLARVDLGAEIPEALYLAVAEVITFAYALSGRLGEERQEARRPLPGQQKKNATPDG